MTAAAATAGVVLDRLLGEPPARWHPVAHFGSAMNVVERTLWADHRGRGIVYVAVGLTLAVVPGVGSQRILGRGVSTAMASGLAIAGSMLEREAQRVAAALVVNDSTDPDPDRGVAAARGLLSRLVGRSTEGLNAAEISRAVVETVAENTVDAATASIFWASVGGAPAVLAHRAINTMDAMVGHRTDRHERFGWASARLDDAMNWLPARLTAAAVMLADPTRARAVWQTVRRDAGAHPSPNGGVVEAAFAASLGIRLGGANVYDGVVEDRGVLGSGRHAGPGDIVRSTNLARRVTAAFAIACLVGDRVTRRVLRSLRRPGSGPGFER